MGQGREIKAMLKYPGSKWSMTDWILQYMPPHEVYVEAFFGSGAVFFRKNPVRVEVINDKDEQVINLFRVCRDQPEDLIRLVSLTPVSVVEHHDCHDVQVTGEPVEDARRLLVRAWQSFGGRIFNRAGWRRNYQATRTTMEDWLGLPERIAMVVDRLRSASIDCEDAVDLVKRFHDPGTLIYADPPYPLSVRSDKVHDKYYRTEMTGDEEHLLLLDALDAHPGMVMISGYSCPLYNERLIKWRRIDRTVNAQGGQERIESLWVNPAAANRVGYQMTIFDLFDEGGR